MDATATKTEEKEKKKEEKKKWNYVPVEILPEQYNNFGEKKNQLLMLL